MKVERLSLQIKGRTLLNEMSFEVPPASIFVILGPNGAGKTLLLRTLAGLLKPSSGSLQHPAEPLAWVPLSQPLPFDYGVSELILMGRFPVHQGFAQNEDYRAADEAMRQTGVLKFAERSYNSLSRGEQTKVDIARALASGSRVILLDEPFSNLDIDAALQIITLFRALRDQGKTLILSHHDLYTARDLATHALLMKEGRVLRCGPMKDVFQSSAIEEAYNVKAVFHDKDGQSFVRFQSMPPVP